MEFKIFHIRKDSAPPYNTEREEVLPIDGFHVVLEHHFYELEFHYFELPVSTDVFIDEIEVDKSLITNDEQIGIVKVGLGQHFSNQLGHATVKIDQDSFQVRVDASKLSSEDAEGMITYLYRKNKSLILQLFTKEEVGGEKNNSTISMTRLSPLEKFINEMENILPALAHSPRYSTIQDREIQDFATENIDEQIV